MPLEPVGASPHKVLIRFNLDDRAEKSTQYGDRPHAQARPDGHAIPLRVGGGKVVTVWAPEDVMGSPIVRAYNTAEFLAAWSTSINEEHERECAKRRRRARIAQIGLVLLLVVVALNWLAP
jgi:hypothetical protein